MAYRDCPCLNCKDRTHGSKRVACHDDCEKYASWKASEQKARTKERESHKPYSISKEKIIRRNLLNTKNRGRR